MSGSSPKRRLIWTVGLSAVVVGVAILQIPSDATDVTDAPRAAAKVTLKRQSDATAKKVAKIVAAKSRPFHLDGDKFMNAVRSGGETTKHNHNDPKTKNAISRGDLSDPLTQDPTTERQAARHVASVIADRAAMPEPKLVRGFKTRHRTAVPKDRYAMAGGCYVMRSTASGGFVHRVGATPSAAKGVAAEPLHFQATHLGRYLLFAKAKDYFGSQAGLLGTTVAFNAGPDEASDWTVSKKGESFRFTLPNGKGLVAGSNGALSIGSAANATPFTLRTTKGCAKWAEIQTNVRRRPFKGATLMQETRGYVDPHTHGMSHEFLGGMVLCGKPWDPYGVTKALVDCPDHTSTAGYGAVLEAFLSGGVPGHDTVGWPTFGYWPNPHSLTHQGVYYKWLERSWRGGLRVFTNLLVQNNVLCELYPLKKNSCNDMDAIRLQAKDMREMQNYIDAQYGGPGRGWYRIVTNPFDARRVINSGKLAVIMGIETSVPFDCNVGNRQPTCTKALIDKGLDEVYKLGVRQMEITNKFDNGLTGVTGDEGSTGVLTNTANFYNTGHFLKMQPCPTSFKKGVQDKQQLGVPNGDIPEQDAIFGAIGKLFGGLSGTVPVYTDKPHCNQAGLTDLGKYLMRKMIRKGMLFDPDHMSVIARRQALTLLEKAARNGQHPGVLSSHSWSTPDAYPRIYKLGGFIAPYAGDSTGFLAKWKQHLKWRDPRYYFGFGYGADMNGFGSQGGPRNPSEAKDVDYPFTGLGGVRISRERGGKRVWDINTDGVAQYGLYPDWIQDVKVLAGSSGGAFMSDMSRGSEAYLETWERALGVANDGCRDHRAIKSIGVFNGLGKGLTVVQVLKRAGQPHTRIGNAFGYCAQRNGRTTHVTVHFSPAGHVTKVG